MRTLFRAAYKTLCAVGRPFGGIRPRRLYDFFGRLAYDAPEFQWFRNRYGDELLLTHFYHIDRNILNFGCYDEDLHAALEKFVKPGMVCFDVGANLGEVTLHMARLAGPDGSVYAFEPVSEVFERLKKNVERNYPSAEDSFSKKKRGARSAAPIHLFKCALSDAKGKAEIARAESGADNQGLASLVNKADVRVAQREEIETVTLDEFVAQEKIPRIDLMKVDIQGAELKLLAGGKRVFTEMSPGLLMEVSPVDLAAAGKNSRDLCEALEAYGYKIFELRGGAVGRQIRAATVSPGFHATNVYCTRKQG